MPHRRHSSAKQKKSLLCSWKQNLYFSHELQSTTAQREHLGCLCAEGELLAVENPMQPLQLVAVRYARLIFNLMLDCDSVLSSVNSSFLQQIQPNQLSPPWPESSCKHGCFQAVFRSRERRFQRSHRKSIFLSFGLCGHSFSSLFAFSKLK